MKWLLLVLVCGASAQTLTGPANVTVGDPVFLRLANGIVPVPGVAVRVSAPARESGIVLTTINFRESAGGAVRGVFYRGDHVLIKGQTGDGWCEVSASSGMAGYVACDYLERMPFGQPVGVTDIDGRVVVLDLAVVPGVLTLEAGGATFSINVAFEAEDTTIVLAPGITQRIRRWAEGPFAMQVIEVDPQQPNVFALPVQGAGLEKTSSMAQRYGAVAAVNGGPSTGFYRLDGRVIRPASVIRTALMRCADGSLVVDGTCSAKDIVGGGPRLVTEGRVDIRDDGYGNDRVRMPRTAFALTSKGTWLFVTVDGRQASSVGMRLDEFAAELVAMGAVRAVNLDGGSSTTMVVDDTVRNSPADGVERQVTDSVLIFSVHDLESLRHVMDRVTLDPGQMAPEAIEPIYQHYDNAVAAFAAEELDRVRLEVEALRAEVQKRSGGELTAGAARALTEAANAYLRLLPGIQQTLSLRKR
jgi:hypothetical protein